MFHRVLSEERKKTYCFNRFACEELPSCYTPALLFPLPCFVFGSLRLQYLPEFKGGYSTKLLSILSRLDSVRSTFLRGESYPLQPE